MSLPSTQSALGHARADADAGHPMRTAKPATVITLKLAARALQKAEKTTSRAPERYERLPQLRVAPVASTPPEMWRSRRTPAGARARQ